MGSTLHQKAAATILVAEDNDEILQIVEEILTRNGFAVLPAVSGAMVVDLARRNKPDIILMDMMMPHLDGYASARLLRRDSSTCKIPIIAFNTPGGRDASISSQDERRLLQQIDRALHGRTGEARFEESSYVKERR